MKNEHDSKDMVQEMVLKTLENLHSLRNEEKFVTWTKSILVNLCKHNLKRNKKWTVEKIPLIMPWTERDLDLEVALGKLKPKQREAIQLFYLLDYDQQTIAKILKVPVGTVKSRVSYGIKELRQLMEVSS
jgi:RNA polymerase sigma-70 factor (ECF subfamily)